MIWYTEELQCEKQDGASITLTGIYNPPGSNKTLVILRLDIELKPGDTIISKILMEKNPSLMRAEDPTPDDIQAKYYRSVLAARDKIMRTPLKIILSW